MNVDKKHIVKLQGKDFITYDGLLDMAHQIDGFKGIETLMIERENGTVIFRAIARTDKQEFYGHGDASPNNVNKMIAPHAIRMAETRAKARALRDLTNVGMCSVEELGGDDAPATKETATQVFDDKLKDLPDDGYKEPKSNTISDKQAGRLFAKAGYMKGEEEAIERSKAIVQKLLDEYGIKSTGEIKKSDYDEICEKAEVMLADYLVPS